MKNSGTRRDSKVEKRQNVPGTQAPWLCLWARERDSVRGGWDQSQGRRCRDFREYQKDTTNGAGDQKAYWRMSLEEVVSHRMVVSKNMSRLVGRRAYRANYISSRDVEANQSGD